MHPWGLGLETFFPQLWAIAWALLPLEVSPLDFLRKDKKSSRCHPWCIFLFTNNQTALPLILIASIATHLLFFTFRFQCGEVVVVRACVCVCLRVLCALDGSRLLYNMPSAFTPRQKSCSCAQASAY